MRPYKISESWDHRQNKRDQLAKPVIVDPPVNFRPVEAYNVVTKQVITYPNGVALAERLGVHCSMVNKAIAGQMITVKDVWICYHADDKSARQKGLDRLVFAIRKGTRVIPEGFDHPVVDEIAKRKPRAAKKTNETCGAFDLLTGKAYQGTTWAGVGRQIGVTGHYLSKWYLRGSMTPVMGQFLVYTNGTLQEALGNLWTALKADRVNNMRLKK